MTPRRRRRATWPQDGFSASRIGSTATGAKHAALVAGGLLCHQSHPERINSSRGWMTRSAMFRDQLVKDARADDASERFEVMCYTARVSAARQLGYVDIARLCRQNLDEDQEMATWLLQHIPAVVSHDAINPATARGRA
jgi:hypothetical protein